MFDKKARAVGLAESIMNQCVILYNNLRSVVKVDKMCRLCNNFLFKEEADTIDTNLIYALNCGASRPNILSNAQQPWVPMRCHAIDTLSMLANLHITHFW